MRPLKFFLIAGAAALLSIIGYDALSITKSQSWLSSQELVTPTPGDDFVQNYSYLTQGSSSEVFISEDGRFVIKRFLSLNREAKGWKKWFPGLASMSAKRREFKGKRERYEGCLNALALIPEETGVLYCHFAPTERWGKSIQLGGEMLSLD